MTKQISFSRVFPAYHARKGQPTHFVEKVLTSLGIDYTTHEYFMWLCQNNKGISERFLDGFFGTLSHDVLPKVHTIRNHKIPVKVGDLINPKCWAGSHLTPPVNPYHKTPDGYWQIKFAPDMEVKKVWKFEIGIEVNVTEILINGCYLNTRSQFKELAANDGLSLDDMMFWFNKSMQGKIISWSDKIEY